MTNGTVRLKRRKGGKTAHLVRYRYCPQRKRSITVTIGSIPLDADPDDVMAFIRVAERNKRSTGRAAIPLLTDDDLVLVRAWLLQHGDRQAADRRKARDARVERAVLERIRVDGNTDGDALTKAVEALQAAGELLCSLSAECLASGGDPWPALRSRYVEVHHAMKEFEKKAKDAGVMKQKRNDS